MDGVSAGSGAALVPGPGRAWTASRVARVAWGQVHVNTEAPETPSVDTPARLGGAGPPEPFDRERVRVKNTRDADEEIGGHGEAPARAGAGNARKERSCSSRRKSHAHLDPQAR